MSKKGIGKIKMNIKEIDKWIAEWEEEFVTEPNRRGKDRGAAIDIKMSDGTWFRGHSWELNEEMGVIYSCGILMGSSQWILNPEHIMYIECRFYDCEQERRRLKELN